MKRTISLLALGLCLASPYALAEEGGNFESRKAEVLKEIDERLAKLQEHKSCVGGAADQEGLKKCRMAMKEFREEQRSEHMDKRMERMNERKQKMEERQKKLEEKKNSQSGQ